MSKYWKVVLTAAFLVVFCGCLFGCGNSGSYTDQLDKSGFFVNTTAEPVSQTKAAEAVRKHFAEENGKVKKAVIIGFDGARAEGLFTVLFPALESNGDYAKSPYSGFNKILDMGGKLYLAQQEASRATRRNSSTQARLPVGQPF